MKTSKTKKRSPDVRPDAGTSPEAGQIVVPLMLGEVIARLRDMIANGDLEPGRPIRERTLGRELGVSRTPLREAFRVLAGEGLIEIRPRLGARVARLSARNADHIFSVMEALEALAGELACKNMSDEDLAELLALHKRLVASYRARQRDRFFTVNQRLHERLIEAAQNPVLSRIYAGLDGQMRRARYMALNTPAQWRDAVREHEVIMKALQARDGARVAALLRGHLHAKLLKVKALLAEQEAGPCS